MTKPNPWEIAAERAVQDALIQELVAQGKAKCVGRIPFYDGGNVGFQPSPRRFVTLQQVLDYAASAGRAAEEMSPEVPW
jgi:hypothetical protein